MRLIWVLINLVIWTIILTFIGLVLSIFDHKGKVFWYIARIWSRIILWNSNVPYEVRGLENLDPKKHYIFASNHESAYDIPLAFAGLPYQLCFIAKIELKRIPIFRWAIIKGKHIFVDRKNHEKAVQSLRDVKEDLEENPRSILLFPEGTRSLDGKIHAFKKGGLLLSYETNMPVVPVAICGTAEVVTKGKWSINARKIELRIGHPIFPHGKSRESKAAFVEQIRSAVIDLKNEWKNSNQ